MVYLLHDRVLPLGWFSKFYVVSFSNAKLAIRPKVLGLPTSRSRPNVSHGRCVRRDETTDHATALPFLLACGADVGLWSQ